MPLDPARAKQLVSKVRDVPHGELPAEADTTLTFLLEQLGLLRELSNDYPRKTISAAVWMDGAALTGTCDELTEILAHRAQPRRQELASRIAVGMACQIMGHYPEQIFPRTVRNARCREAIQQIDAAISTYKAVVDDFSALHLEELLDEPDSLDESERTILSAVGEALERLLVLQPPRAAERQALLKRVDARLGPRAPP
jgi:hypothetical protein